MLFNPNCVNKYLLWVFINKMISFVFTGNHFYHLTVLGCFNLSKKFFFKKSTQKMCDWKEGCHPSVCWLKSHSRLSALLVENGGGWSIKGSKCLWHVEWLFRWMMQVAPEPLLCVHGQRLYLVWIPEGVSRWSMHSLTVLYIHSSSCRRLEACCPTGRLVG